MTNALPVHGIDISHHQSGKIDFAAMKRTGVQFVYHKATEGDTYSDPMYTQRRREVAAAGLPFGAYHFARPELGDAASEARRFIKVADPKPGDLIPVLDLETTEGLSLQALETWAEQFSKTVKGLTGFWPVVYTPYVFSKSRVPGLRWVPRYNNDNIPPRQTNVDIWQFSNGVYGTPFQINGLKCDLNTFRGSTTVKDIVMPKTPTQPTKPPAKSVKLLTMHFSLQYSDTAKQQTYDAEKLFKLAVDNKAGMRASWVTGTEAGETDLWDIVRTAGVAAGYRMHRSRGNWIAIDREIIKKGSVTQGDVFVMDNDEVVGHGHDPDFPWVTFEHKTPGVGVISVSAVHYPTHGQTPKAPNHWVNQEYAKKLGEWGQEASAGNKLAFVQGDFNMPDQHAIDLFFGEPFTTYGDELKKWPNTGHGPIDAMATWDKDGRVKVLSYVVLDDKIFFLNTDHFGIAGVIEVKLLSK